LTSLVYASVPNSSVGEVRLRSDGKALADQFLALVFA
jgi:hypothetical protein